MKYLIVILMVAYMMIVAVGYMVITANGRALRAEALERATRASFESYLRTRGQISPAYICKEKP
jgi:hypothetical protein